MPCLMSRAAKRAKIPGPLSFSLPRSFQNHISQIISNASLGWSPRLDVVVAGRVRNVCILRPRGDVSTLESFSLRSAHNAAPDPDNSLVS